MKGSTTESFVCFGDAHGDMCSRSTIDALEKHIAELKPKHRICLGDMFDLRSLRKGVSNQDSEHYDSLMSDLTQGYNMLERLRPTVFLNGNHEFRLYNTAENAVSGIVRQYCADGVDKLEKYLRKMGCKVYPYHYDQGVHRIGSVAFVHGYTANMAAVKQHAEIYADPGGAVVMGHIHRIEAVQAVRHGGAKGYSYGCLADIPKLKYAALRPATMRWENGWVFGIIGKGKQNFKIWQAERTNGKWILPTSLREL